MLRRIVKLTDNGRLGRKVLTDRKNNLRANVGRVREEKVEVVAPAPVVKEKKSEKKISGKKSSKK